MKTKETGLFKSAYNRLLIRATLFHRGPASRVELGALTGLPLSALTRLCPNLIRTGYIREGPLVRPRGSGRGRRRTLLEVNAAGLGVLCLYYDRRRIEAAIADLTGSVRWRRGWEGPFERGPAQVLEHLERAVKTALRETPLPRSRLLAVGAADPGLVERSSGRAVRAVNLPGWENVGVAEVLERASGLPVLIERAAGLQAVGEAAFGAGRGAQHVLFITLVAQGGVGGGLVDNGRLVTGFAGGAGEIGHVHVSDDQAPCGCGLRGCLEAHLAPERLLERCRASGGLGVADLPDYAAFLARAHGGDPVCRAALEHAARMLASALGSAINLLNPERVVLGGLLADAGELLVQPLRASLPKYALREHLRDLEICLAERGEEAAYLGIVAQARESLFAYPAASEPMPRTTPRMGVPSHA